MDEHGAVFFTCGDDGAYTLRSAFNRSLVGAGSQHADARRRILVYYLAECKNLPYRNTAVWKKDHLERNVEMDGKIVISFRACAEEDETDRCCLLP